MVKKMTLRDEAKQVQDAHREFIQAVDAIKRTDYVLLSIIIGALFVAVAGFYVNFGH